MHAIGKLKFHEPIATWIGRTERSDWLPVQLDGRTQRLRTTDKKVAIVATEVIFIEWMRLKH